MSDVQGEAVVQAYRFALDPSAAQVRDLQRHCGAARFAFNWALAAVKANLDQRGAERSYGIAEAELTPGVGWNLPALRRAWNAAKPMVAPWWAACSKESYNTGLDGLARALNRFTTGTIRVEADRHHVTLPRLGRIRTHESTRKLARRLEAGTARIMSATVRNHGGRWHVSFTVQITRRQHLPARPNAIVGVDLGVSNLAVLSTGELIPNPKHLNQALGRLRSTSRTLARRQGPDRRTGQQPSKRWQPPAWSPDAPAARRSSCGWCAARPAPGWICAGPSPCAFRCRRRHRTVPNCRPRKQLTSSVGLVGTNHRARTVSY